MVRERPRAIRRSMSSPIPNVSAARVVVVGDVMLDRYWSGDSRRISPEAPVPVVHVRDTRDVPGGAANVAMNIAELGAQAALVSALGDDDEGRRLEAVLAQSGIDGHFVRGALAQTTVKLRVLARGQQVVRADFEGEPAPGVTARLATALEAPLARADAVVFSDYGKGVLRDIAVLVRQAKARGAHVLVDPKGADYGGYRGADVVTPNREELAQVVGRWSGEADFEARAFRLRDELGLGALLVTRSEEGMSLFTGARHLRIATVAREVYDVSGAGDTVIATLACMLAAGLDIEAAARLANTAAGVVVGKRGTTPIRRHELEAALGALRARGASPAGACA